MTERRGKRDSATSAPPTSAAHRTIDDVRRLLDEARHPDQLAEVQERLRAALDAVEAAASETVGSVLPEASRAVADQLAEAERRIRENPLGALLVAAGLGLVAGLLLARR